ncbi:hypothetical protein B7P33_12635 [Sediminicola luteus]|uniref:Uncharacterized protein n=2 Tax=Sediminicola luteus TaxID=319238 RepID=A0A2A4G539_9FLAO|nr:hypothetical protein B7P33_12635 [Sediminicola luteus]
MRIPLLIDILSSILNKLFTRIFLQHSKTKPMYLKPLLICTLLITSFTQAQKKKSLVGRVGGYEMGMVECHKTPEGYTFTYENDNEIAVNDYASFSIPNTENSLEQLYKTIQKGLTENPKKDVRIETNSDFVWLEFTRFLGKTVYRFKQSTKEKALGHDYSAWITKKETERLFGKK